MTGQSLSKFSTVAVLTAAHIIAAAQAPVGVPASEPVAPKLHHAFTVPGGAAMGPLKCNVVQKGPAPEVRPSDAGPAPAGSEEEELPLTDQQEQELRRQLPPIPTAEEIRKGMPHEEWLRLMHQKLKDASQTRIARIGIWGGSHMAAEFFVSELLRQFQGRFGAGGAGHVNLLYGLPGIRLPVNALCRQGKWHHELAPRAPGAPAGATGLGLFALSSREAGASIEIDPGNPALGATVHTVTVHYLRQPEGGLLDVLVDGVLAEAIDTSGPSAVASVQINGVKSISRVKLIAHGSEPVTLLGAFADGEKGVVLDNFGIAGASGNYWANVRTDLLRHASGQRPYDMVMLAYGTNDVTGANWDPADYRRRFEATIESMRQVLPQAQCVLITPGDRASSFKARSVVKGKDGKSRRVVQTRYDLKTFPQRHKEAAQIQREVGNRYQCMTWDMSLEMRKAGGAYQLMKKNPPWMARDLIHLTPLGYQEMAKALIQWLRI